MKSVLVVAVATIVLAVSLLAKEPKEADFPQPFAVRRSYSVSVGGCYMILSKIPSDGWFYTVKGLGVLHCTIFKVGTVLPGRIGPGRSLTSGQSIDVLGTDEKGRRKIFLYNVVGVRSEE